MKASVERALKNKNGNGERILIAAVFFIRRGKDAPVPSLDPATMPQGFLIA